MKIAFIGTGYVGLVSGTMMAHLGFNIICIDKDLTKINALKNGVCPIYEKDLEKYLHLYSKENNTLNFSNNLKDIADVDIVFFAVGTPTSTQEGKNGEADLSFLFEAVKSAAQYAKNGAIFVVKSTVPPTTCNSLISIIKQQEPNKNISIASNPEFLREGSGIEDFLFPDRIIIGIDKNSENGLEVQQTMQKLYQPLLNQNKTTELIFTDLISSELIKYASNAFLANKIAFINEIADLCENIDADSNLVALGMGLDRRINKEFLNPGPGFGGSCFPKDILALSALSKKYNVDSNILDAVITSNKERTDKMVNKIKKIFANNLKDVKLGIFGLTYKAGTDDIRSSPAIDIVEKLEKNGAIITAYDPKGMEKTKQLFPKINCASSPIEAAKNANAIIILTEWPEFKNVDYGVMYKSLASPATIIDLRNILDEKHIKSMGYRYFRVGKK